MSQAPDDPDKLVAIPPPEQVPAPPPTPEELTHTGVPICSEVGAKLAGAMFLHHAALGAWIVTLGSYIKAHSGSGGMFSDGFVGSSYGAGPLGALIAPFLTGFLADHFFATERIMAVLHLLAAAALCGAIVADSQSLFYVALLGYFLCFVPSFALMSSMTLHHLSRPERDFPIIRAFSTMGWVAGGVFVGSIWPRITGNDIEATVIPMKIGVCGEFILAAFCLWLPHTPPVNKTAVKGPPRLSGSDTLELLGNRRFAALLVIAMLAHVPSQFYYAYGNIFFNWTGMRETAAQMTMGQMVEVVCMFLLPAVLLRVRIKTSIAIGLATWALRFAMLAVAASDAVAGRNALLYGAILLHGVAFTLLTISLQLDVDRAAGRKRRATAQGLLSVAMQGFGCFIGAELAGRAGAQFLPSDLDAATVAGWQSFWTLPAWGAAAVLVIALILLPRGRA